MIGFVHPAALASENAARALAHDVLARSRARFQAILVVLCGLAAWHAYRLPLIVVDDAFISYRYAHNLVRGDGLVFNAGERVEGYSNPLWVLLTALGMRVGLDPIAWTRSLGIMCVLGTTIISTQLAKRLTASDAIAGCVGFVLAASTALVASSLSGLETGLYMLLVTAALAALLTDRLLTASLLLGLSAITRPEGVALWIGCTMLLFVLGKNRTRGRVLKLLVPAGLIILLMLVFRFCYYGELLPNSVQAKSAMLPLLKLTPVSDWLSLVLNQPGLAYAGGFLVYTFGLACAIALVPSLRGGSMQWRGLILLATVVFGLVVAIYNFGDWMTAYRLLAPYLPALTVLVGWGLLESAEWIAERFGIHLFPLARLIAICILLYCGLRQFQFRSPATFSNPDAELAAVLNVSKQPDLLAATDVLGRVGYYAPDVHWIDMGGLADAHIAKHGKPCPPFGKSDFDYVLSREPHFIMNNVRSAWERRLKDGCLVHNYWWVDFPRWSSSAEPNAQPRFVLIRRGSILETEMRAKYPNAEFTSPVNIVTP